MLVVLSFRLLLGQTMNRTEAPDQLDTIDADYFVLGQVFLQDLHSTPIVLPMPIGRHEQRTVDEIEVDIRCRQPLTIVLDYAGHGDFDDLERLAILIAELFELFTDTL